MRKKTRAKTTRAKRLPSVTRGRASGIRKWTKQLLEMAESGLVSGLRFTYSVVGPKKKKKKTKTRRKAKAAVSARKAAVNAQKRRKAQAAVIAQKTDVSAQNQSPEMSGDEQRSPT